MEFNPGFAIHPTTQPMGFEYGPGVFGLKVENRTLDSIRKSLRDPDCELIIKKILKYIRN